MRAVDKGEAPGTEYKKYQDAEPELEAALGGFVLYGRRLCRPGAAAGRRGG